MKPEMGFYYSTLFDKLREAKSFAESQETIKVEGGAVPVCSTGHLGGLVPLQALFCLPEEKVLMESCFIFGSVPPWHC